MKTGHGVPNHRGRKNSKMSRLSVSGLFSLRQLKGTYVAVSSEAGKKFEAIKKTDQKQRSYQVGKKRKRGFVFRGSGHKFTKGKEERSLESPRSKRSKENRASKHPVYAVFDP